MEQENKGIFKEEQVVSAPWSLSAVPCEAIPSLAEQDN